VHPGDLARALGRAAEGAADGAGEFVVLCSAGFGSHGPRSSKRGRAPELSYSPWNRAGGEDKAAEIARRAAADLALVEIAVQAVAAIRAALALRNAALGVSTRLAEAEAANRRVALYKAIVDGQKPDMVRPEDVRALPAGLTGETESWSFARRGATAVTLQTADKALLEALREKLAREQARATRLLDEVADLNRERLEIDLPQEIAGIAGLAE